MANKQGDFIWYELLTSDPDAAAAFYGAVVGWKGRELEAAYGGYRIFSSEHGDVAGYMETPAEAAAAGMRPAWLGYVAVEDVDAKTREIVEAGGSVHMGPMDIPNVGRFALAADPQGGRFYIMKGMSEGTSQSFDQAKAGHGNWNELATSDQAGAFAFYGRLFGWTKGDSMPMGEMGEYQFIIHAGQTIGGVMKRPEGGPPVGWCFYFGVGDIEAAAKAVTDGGGAVMHGPAEVPGGARIIVAQDPQGAIFGAVGPAKA